MLLNPTLKGLLGNFSPWLKYFSQFTSASGSFQYTNVIEHSLCSQEKSDYIQVSSGTALEVNK